MFNFLFASLLAWAKDHALAIFELAVAKFILDNPATSEDAAVAFVLSREDVLLASVISRVPAFLRTGVTNEIHRGTVSAVKAFYASLSKRAGNAAGNVNACAGCALASQVGTTINHFAPAAPYQSAVIGTLSSTIPVATDNTPAA